jgi:hypothetical protein
METSDTKLHKTNISFACSVLVMSQTSYHCVGFEVLKSIIFWDMTPCSPLCSNRRFGGT